ncbi:unnamed protein product [Nesidiocoris tenuis]|uniref:Uncharacterized protein n=1 Tax=Nesidiocoris tenuis TaxID=355587 RepID=A0A6H5HG71_9HEMI|nr:unnamed protein product [Nesidiocoris tenuis]
MKPTPVSRQIDVVRASSWIPTAHSWKRKSCFDFTNHKEVRQTILRNRQKTSITKYHDVSAETRRIKTSKFRYDFSNQTTIRPRRLGQ